MFGGGYLMQDHSISYLYTNFTLTCVMAASVMVLARCTVSFKVLEFGELDSG